MDNKQSVKKEPLFLFVVQMSGLGSGCYLVAAFDEEEAKKVAKEKYEESSEFIARSATDVSCISIGIADEKIKEPEIVLFGPFVVVYTSKFR